MNQIRLKIEQQLIANEFWGILQYTDIQFMFEKVLDEYYLRVDLRDLNNLKDKIQYSTSEYKSSLTYIFETALITTLTNLGE
jgi:hypothetical protein